MAAGLGFKTFTTGEVLTAADTNGYLMQGVLVFASAAARDAAITSPQEGQFAYLKDTNATTYYTGSAWAASGGGGGKVLQVVSTTNSTAKTITSTTYTDTNLTLSITPTAATSKVLILITQMSETSSNGATNKGSGLRIVRDSTSIYEPAIGKYEMQYVQAGSGPIDVLAPISLSYLDSPATTAATTYKTQGALNATTDSASLKYQTGSSISTITLLEIGA